MTATMTLSVSLQQAFRLVHNLNKALREAHAIAEDSGQVFAQLALDHTLEDSGHLLNRISELEQAAMIMAREPSTTPTAPRT